MHNVYPFIATNSKALLNGHIFHVPGQQSGNPLTFHNNQHRSTMLGCAMQFLRAKDVIIETQG